MNRINRETRKQLILRGRPAHPSAIESSIIRIESLRAVSNTFTDAMLSAAPLTDAQKSARAARSVRRDNLRHGFVQAHRMIAIRRALKAGRDDHPLLKTLMGDAIRMGVRATTKIEAANALLSMAIDGVRATRKNCPAPSRLAFLHAATQSITGR
jgi:hypothetical protein